MAYKPHIRTEHRHGARKTEITAGSSNDYTMSELHHTFSIRNNNYAKMFHRPTDVPVRTGDRKSSV